MISRARSLTNADIGVHLNLTHGRPLTQALASRFERFPHRNRIALTIATRQISTVEIKAEWEAQIEHVAEARPVFVNSHEHLHMLPGLFSEFCDLARRFSIHWIRVSGPEWSGAGSAAALLRNSVLAATSLLNRKPAGLNYAELYGMAPSGKLDSVYLRRLLMRLKPGGTYELMCHPGNEPLADTGTLSDYHDWEGEKQTLTDPANLAFARQQGVHITRFSELT